MVSKEITDKLKQHEPRSMGNYLPLVWKSAKKDIVTDVNNKKYIDFTSTIFVQNFGHSNSKVKKYIKKQLKRNLLHTYTYSHETRAKFLTKLSEVTGYEKAFLLSSGTEATEAAVKLMRMHGKSLGKYKIVSFEGAMHGRTMAASIMKNNYEYDHPDFIRLPYPTDSSCFKKDLGDPSQVAGIIIESYQGWSARFMPIKYIRDLVAFCNNNDILVCLDEIQAGLYRCGTLFGFNRFNIKPDIVCLGKALGGGLPLSAVLSSRELLDIPNMGEMSSTHSANPLCCAAGLAILEEIENLDHYKLNVNTDIFRYGIESTRAKFPGIIKDYACHGMVGSLIFNNKKIASEVCLKCLEKGLLLVHTGRESIKLGPPLVIKNNNLLRGFKIIQEAISECH